MKLIEADKVEQAIKDYWKAQVDKALTLTDGNEKRITIYLEHNHELLKAIDELPSIQPDTTTHDSIPAKTGENDEDRTTDDLISRQVAIDFVGSMNMCDEISNEAYEKLTSYLDELPSTQSDIILCPNCYYNDGTAYCELHYRDVKAKDFCSWAERREDATD